MKMKKNRMERKMRNNKGAGILAACSVVGYGDDDERYPFAMFL